MVAKKSRTKKQADTPDEKDEEQSSEATSSKSKQSDDLPNPDDTATKSAPKADEPTSKKSSDDADDVSTAVEAAEGDTQHVSVAASSAPQKDAAITESYQREIGIYVEDPPQRSVDGHHHHGHFCTLKFYNFPKQSQAVLLLNPDSEMEWSIGPNKRQIKGLHVFSPTGDPLALHKFLLNPRELLIQTRDEVSHLVVELFARSCGSRELLRGTAMLPPGLQLTLESVFDRTSVIGRSSFTISLHPR